jgi:hypothetical protein
MLGWPTFMIGIRAELTTPTFSGLSPAALDHPPVAAVAHQVRTSSSSSTCCSGPSDRFEYDTRPATGVTPVTLTAPLTLQQALQWVLGHGAALSLARPCGSVKRVSVSEVTHAPQRLSERIAAAKRVREAGAIFRPSGASPDCSRTAPSTVKARPGTGNRIVDLPCLP